MSTGPAEQGKDSGWRFGARLLASCLLLLGLAMVQSPGLVVPDTKLDLVVDPWGFLERAAHLWDPEAAFGQLQNQAYGYLWPMGPYFLVGAFLDLPGWVVQRLWIALVMCVALTGAAKVARALEVKSDLACIAAGFAYALSPRMLTVLGPISIEAWPSALAPWVLLPLIMGSTRGSPRRAAALSALAVAMVGGVNAAATAAVLPLGALWLLTRTPGSRRRSMMIWWPLFTLLGTLWWLVPLFLMGAYSPPFLDYIESAANTTFPATLFDALRGTSNWVPYVDTSSRAGNDLIREFHLVLNSGVVLAMGLAGLMLRRNPHRLFLASGVIVGLVLVTMGHTGATQGWGAAQMQELLDGPLAPLRNAHKFDPVLRLPLVIGLAWGVDRLMARAGRAATLPERLYPRVIAGIAVFAVAAASLPAATGRISPADGFADIPDYWHEAASWLGEHHDEGVALLAPGSSFGTYAWGNAEDEPMQALADKPWAVRNAVPLAPAGNIRMLDAIEDRLAQGRPSDGLATYLRRAGISHLVVRNDLKRQEDIPDPVRVHQAIEGSAGLVRVASFGPMVGGESNLEDEDGDRVVVNGGWQDEYPAIEVYDVAGDPGYATSSDVMPVVVGGPADLLSLTDLSLLGDAPTRLAADIGEEGEIDPAAPLILTDGLRAVERNFGRLHDATSATRVPEQTRRLGGRVTDYLLPHHDRWATWATYEGVEGVKASSSQADASAYGPVEPGQQPYAAADGLLDTEWVSGADGDHWWQVDLAQTRAAGEVRITGSGPNRQTVRLRTEAGTSAEIELAPGVTRTLELEGPTKWIRVEDASGRNGERLRLAEVNIERVDVQRPLVLPEVPSTWGAPDAVLLRAVTDSRTGCVQVDDATRCVAGQAIASEEPIAFERHVPMAHESGYELDLRVRPRPGGELEEFLLTDQLVGATATSSGNPDVQSSVLAAIDGDRGTTWSAALSDEYPELNLRWVGRRTITGLKFDVADGAAARAPDNVLMEWPEGEGSRRTLHVGDDGEVSFPPIRSSRIRLTILDAESVMDLGFDGQSRPVPVGISEVSVEGVPLFPLRLTQEERVTPCGAGPDVRVNGDLHRTRVTASPREVYEGGSFRAELCGTDRIELESGVNELSFVGSNIFVPESAVLSRTQIDTGSARALESNRVGPVQRQITPPEDGGTVSTRENGNPGWTARQDGVSLDSQTTDGWRKGWVTRSESTVISKFTPDTPYRIGLFGGLAALLLLGLATLVPRSRWGGSTWGPVGSRSTSAVSVLASVPLAGGLLGGWTGAAAAACGALIGATVVRRWPSAVWVAGLLLVPSVVAYMLNPWGDAAGWAGGHAWVSHQVLLAVSAAVGATTGLSLPRFLSRRKGSSTVR